ncbi:MAG: DNA repair protein RecO [Phycisphaera sp.]|nr:DNA repair protein RecO [Phycisphaera sp.]
MPTIKDNAVCVRLRDWSESSQIVVLMTEHHGKVAAAAKGAKRTTPSTMAKFSGGVELLTAGEAVMIVKPSTELAQLIEWDLVDAHWHLRRNLRAYQLAMYGADLVHHIVQDHDAHPATYHALRRLLSEVGGAGGGRGGDAKPQAADAALLRFQWDVLVDMGSRPVLDRDAQTGGAIDAGSPTVGFSASAGGVVADTGAGDRWRARRETIDLLAAVEADDDLSGYDAEALDRANRLLCTYLRSILDRQLPTMDYVLK